MLGSPGRLLESLIPIEGFPAIDLNSAGQNGIWVSLREAKRCLVLLVAAPGTAADTTTLTLQQAKDSSGTGAKALNFTTFYTKEVATNQGGANADLWTKNTQASANTISDTASDKDQMWGVEFHAEELDDANGFFWLRGTVNQPGHAKIGYLLYLLGDLRFPGAPEKMLTATS